MHRTDDWMSEKLIILKKSSVQILQIYDNNPTRSRSIGYHVSLGELIFGTI